MRGEGFFDPDTGENALGSPLTYVDRVFNIHALNVRFIGEDLDTPMKFSGKLKCTQCSSETDWTRALKNFFPLRGFDSISMCMSSRMSATLACSKSDCYHLEVKRLVPLAFPAFLFVELSKDERSADPGIPSSFKLEPTVFLGEFQYELISIVYIIPGSVAHFNSDALRDFNSVNAWFKVDDLLSHVSKLRDIPSTEVITIFFSLCVFCAFCLSSN